MKMSFGYAVFFPVLILKMDIYFEMTYEIMLDYCKKWFQFWIIMLDRLSKDNSC